MISLYLIASYEASECRDRQSHRPFAMCRPRPRHGKGESTSMYPMQRRVGAVRRRHQLAQASHGIPRATFVVVLLVLANLSHGALHHFEGGALDAVLAQLNAFAARLSQDL